MAKVLGVKEAMRHYVSTLENVTAATTIKGLTKQIMIATVGEDAGISEARTIAEIYEAAAIANGYGYEPEEDPTGAKKLYLNNESESFNITIDTAKSDFDTPAEIYSYLESGGKTNLEIYVNDVNFNFDPSISDVTGEGWVLNGTPQTMTIQVTESSIWKHS